MAWESLKRLAEVVELLRRECPWDRAQTLFSMRYQALEEVYEYIEAIERGDRERIVEEIGDLLTVALMLLKIAEDEGVASADEILERTVAKLIFKHPHIFSDKKDWGMKEVLENWENTKKDGILSGVDTRRPALVTAHRIGEKVARVGFDWESAEEVLKKVKEECREFLEAQNEEERREELGDLLFALAQYARKVGYYAEDSLRKANDKFKRRFSQLELEAKRRGKSLKDMSLKEMDGIWERIKKS
ncbi:MAG: nucleoside triphosphate pyrophosphohydrolase [Thermotogae bacterium]|nr:nucleoside triphosphate pyrophosphohydrolase [Thermotogota bacterium]